MKLFIQWEEDGAISTCFTDKEHPPIHPRQKEFPLETKYFGMRMNLQTLELELVPEEENE